MVVGMTAQTHRNRHVLVLAQIIGRTHIVQRLRLQHEMIEALGRVGGFDKGERMMARIAVEKGGLKSCARGRRDMDIIADPHPQDISIKVDALLGVIHQDHKMSQALLSGFKARDRSRRLKRFIKMNERTIEYL